MNAQLIAILALTALGIAVLCVMGFGTLDSLEPAWAIVGSIVTAIGFLLRPSAS